MLTGTFTTGLHALSDDLWFMSWIGLLLVICGLVMTHMKMPPKRRQAKSA